MSEILLNTETWTNAEIARTGALHLAELVQKSGQFTYAYWLGGGRIPGYNLLRHCGAIWAMADVARGLPAFHPINRAAKRAVGWLLEKKTRTLDKGLCLAGKGGTSKLGGAALATLACLEVNRTQPDPRLLQASEAFGRFIMMMRLPNGDFIHKIDIDQKKALPFRSEYYTGEALFALAKLYDQTQDTRWRDALVHSARKLSEIDYGVMEQSHWMLYALNATSRFAITELCVNYGKRIVEDILDRPDYRSRNQSTPTACRSEGMLAFVAMSADSTDPEVRRVRKRAITAIEENLDQQRVFFDPSGAFIRGSGKDDVRIDFIQHNISSFLHYERIVTRHDRTPLMPSGTAEP